MPQERIGVIYARFSSHNQKEESIEQQVEECTEFAESKGIKISHVYADKAVSGRTDKRAAFQRMMKDASQKKFDVVISYKTNRIARNMLNALQYEEKLSQYGIETLYAKEEYGNTPAGRLALRMMMSVNQFYSENLAEDIRRGLKDNAQKAKVNGSLPLGYKKGEDGRYAIDAEKAALVREIYQRTKDGEKFKDIAADLNDRGLKTKNGTAWNKGSFHHLLTNDVYTGVYRHSGIVLENAVPVIIPKDEFEEMQDLLHTKKNPIGRHRSDTDYLLTGKLFCGHCGAPMVGMSATSHTGTRHYYYICKGRCGKKNVRKDYIEKTVCDITRDCFLNDDVIKWISHALFEAQDELEEETDIPILKRQKEDDERGLRNLLRALSDGLVSKTVSQEVERLEKEIAQLERQIRAWEQNRTTEQDWIDFFCEFKNGHMDDPEWRKYVINSFVNYVKLYDDEFEITYHMTGMKDPRGDPVRIRSNQPHHTLTIRTYTIVVYVKRVTIKGKLPS